MYNDKNVQAHYTALSKQCNLKLISLSDITIKPELFQVEHCYHYLQNQAIPISITSDSITIATSNPHHINIEKIKKFFDIDNNKKIDFFLISRQDIVTILSTLFKKELTHDITYKRYDMDPTHSASYTFSLSQKIILLTILVAIIFCGVLNLKLTIFYICFILSLLTVILMAYKIGLALRLVRWPIKKITSINTPDSQLPIYTILIPMLREKKITISLLLDALSKLDYPHEKLDVKFLLEEDDSETQKTLSQFELPWYYDVLIVPPGLPQSKPRACNYGLYLSFGQYLVIYDAEDRPDADQLKKALECFAENDEKTMCVQAALNYYNYKENLLTKLFTLEYSYWFDYLVPGLVYLRAPVPLGGTSNHFKVQMLINIGAWDPYIGTEDAEVGVRIYRRGYKTNYIASTTYEEANNNLKNWFKQRARWNKGYMQTYLVNMRDPIRMLKEIGFERFFNFHYFVGGNVFIQLANLPLWIFFIASFFNINIFIAHPYLKILFYISWYNFIISNCLLIFGEFYAVLKRRLYCLLPYAPLKFAYWLMMSFAGYYAIFELLIRPSYWYKTEHGLSKQTKNTDVPIK